MAIDDRDSRDPDAPRATATVRDRRLIPRGGLPRQIQTWLMIGVAVVILLIILVSGHPQPPAAPLANQPPSATLAPAERIRGFERQLSDDEARLREMAARSAAGQNELAAAQRAGAQQAMMASPQTRAQEPSLASDNVAFSTRQISPGVAAFGRPGDAPNQASTTNPELAALEQWLKTMTAAMPQFVSPAQPVVSGPRLDSVIEPPAQPTSDPPAAPVPSDRFRLLEGTLIEAVLLNRLDGTYSGPVAALVTGPVYSSDRRHVIIPAGARVVGSVSPVQSWGDARLAVSFHRLVMPTGETYSLDQFKGLNQIGETGLRDVVNRHYWQVFGASLAVGALSGLAQFQTRSGFDATFADTARQGAGSSFATSAARILDRYLNVLPTVTIREGYRLKVYLTSDLDLPAYRYASGGVR